MTYTISGLGSTTIIASGAVASYAVTTGTAQTCPTTTVGACQLSTACAASSQPTVVDAGTVTITGLATSPVTLSRISSTAGYISTSYTSYLWTTSTPATVTVGGSSAVPAYDMTITAPHPITLTAPAPTGTATTGASYAFSKSADLVVSWTGGVEGQVIIGVQSTDANSQATVTCSVPASAGTVTVPASLMSGLGTMGGFTASVTSSATKTVSDWLMDFQATVAAAVGTITFTN